MEGRIMYEGQLADTPPHPASLGGRAATEHPAPQSNGGKLPMLVSLARRLRENQLLFRLMTKSFRALQGIGINVTPNHFYFPTPDVAQLELREWPVDALPVGLDLQLDRQLEFLQTVPARYRGENAFSSTPDQNCGYHYQNGFFETVDAETAYYFVREHKPARILEIGSGFSSCVLALALQRNLERDGVKGGLTSIDPFPSPLPSSYFDEIRVIASRVQDVPLNEFTSLAPGDILFIDSSHVVSTGSDVIREYLEILPRLQSGVIVHIHDIFLPADYPRDMVIKNLTFWSEQYLLQAFLTFNPAFEVLWSSSAMQIFHPAALEAAFPHWKHSYKAMPVSARRFVPTMDGERVWPSSFWMRRI
jgi:hypothetical protein